MENKILSMMEKFDQSYHEFRRKRRDEQKALEDRLSGYQERINKARSEIEDLKKDLKKNLKDYTGKLKALDKEVELKIKDQERIRTAFNDGKIGLDEFEKSHQAPWEVERETRLNATEGLAPIRAAIGDKHREILKRFGLIFDLNRKCSIIIGEFLKKNIDFLKKEGQNLENLTTIVRGSSNAGNANDLRIIDAARTGKSLDPIVFDRIESWEQMEKIILSGAVWPDFYESFDKLILRIKHDEGIDFSKQYLRIIFHTVKFAGIGTKGFEYRIIKKP
jgi:hypothetical protein